MSNKIHITAHAYQKWRHLSRLHNMDPSNQALLRTINRAVPEQHRTRAARFHMLKRSIIRGETNTLVTEGIRFVITQNRCVTIEMVHPHQNYFHG